MCEMAAFSTAGASCVVWGNEQKPYNYLLVLAMNDARLWGELNGLMCYHQKRHDPSPMAAVNRLFGEFFHSKRPPVAITEQNTVISRGQWSPQELDAIERKDLPKLGSKGLFCPAVVVEYGGAKYLIDGRRRVNQWVAEKSCLESHAVLLLKVKDEAQ